MSTFASVYRPTKHQQSLLLREQKRISRKRKRRSLENAEINESNKSASKSPSPDAYVPRPASASAHPVNNTDPYYIAGLSRELDLPPYPFPHAPANSLNPPNLSIEEHLAAVSPSLYVPKTDLGEPATSLKRRHLDNITAILHQCMLKGDWQRASRAWSLLLRTEISGSGIDVRQHGRWGIGAELLMRRKEGPQRQQQNNRDPQEDSSSGQAPANDAASSRTESPFSDQGFALAREYYQRLILQYPHIPRYPHGVNATLFYPALFNIWVYEVQHRYKRLRQATSNRRPSFSGSSSSSNINDADLSTFSDTLDIENINKRELEDALPIAQRLDELLLSPPYDTSLPLLHLRGMIGLWLSDLHTAQSEPSPGRTTDLLSASLQEEADTSSYSDRVIASQNREKAKSERKRAYMLLKKVRASSRESLFDQVTTLDPEQDLSE